MYLCEPTHQGATALRFPIRWTVAHLFDCICLLWLCYLNNSKYRFLAFYLYFLIVISIFSKVDCCTHCSIYW